MTRDIPSLSGISYKPPTTDHYRVRLGAGGYVNILMTLGVTDLSHTLTERERDNINLWTIHHETEPEKD